MPPLSPPGTSKLLELLVGAGRLTQDTRQTLVAASGGNPLFVEEYARMLTEGNADAAALDGAQTQVPVPDTIQQLIAARIDTLPPADKRLLQDAAAIGEVGWVGALAAVSRRDRADVELSLGRLERLEFLRRARATSVAGETEYAFRHGLIRDVAYALLLRTDRIERHQRVAAWIQALNPGRTDERAELLAQHYRQALTLSQAAGQPAGDLVDQARKAARLAGDRATALGALRTRRPALPVRARPVASRRPGPGGPSPPTRAGAAGCRARR